MMLARSRWPTFPVVAGMIACASATAPPSMASDVAMSSGMAPNTESSTASSGTESSSGASSSAGGLGRSGKARAAAANASGPRDAHAHGREPVRAASRALSSQTGEATYYGRKFDGRRTASGEAYDPRAFTAAHRKLPFGSVVRVVRVDDPTKVVYVRINDRGPFGSRRRVIDLSRAAARKLDMLSRGVVSVRVEVLEYGRR